MESNLVRKKQKIRIAIYLILICSGIIYIWIDYYPHRERVILTQKQKPLHAKLIAHAMGAIEGFLYTNTWEAFEENYQKSFRYFEIDLELTNSGTLICFHNGMERSLGLSKSIHEITDPEISQLKYAGRWPLLTAKTFLKRLQDYKDVTLILDTKGDFSSMLRSFVSIANEVNPEVLEHTIPQIYGYGYADLEKAKSTYDFQQIIYTLYRTAYNPDRILKFLTLNKVSAVTMPRAFISDPVSREIRAFDIPVFLHAINDCEQIGELIQAGAQGVYTASCPPQILEESNEN